MTKPTPGPWFQGTDPRQIESSKDGTIVCRVSGSLSNESTLADAHLIAAAPDLLEALKAMNDAWMCNIEWHDWESSVKKARAAIAKAEGRG